MSGRMFLTDTMERAKFSEGQKDLQRISERVMSVPALVCMTGSGVSFLAKVECVNPVGLCVADVTVRHIQTVAHQQRLGKEGARKAALLRNALLVCQLFSRTSEMRWLVRNVEKKGQRMGDVVPHIDVAVQMCASTAHLTSRSQFRRRP